MAGDIDTLRLLACILPPPPWAAAVENEFSTSVFVARKALPYLIYIAASSSDVDNEKFCFHSVERRLCSSVNRAHPLIYCKDIHDSSCKSGFSFGMSSYF